MITRSVQPATLAAVTKSSPRSASSLPRTSRARPGQPSSERMIEMTKNPVHRPVEGDGGAQRLEVQHLLIEQREPQFVEVGELMALLVDGPVVRVTGVDHRHRGRRLREHPRLDRRTVDVGIGEAVAVELDPGVEAALFHQLGERLLVHVVGVKLGARYKSFSAVLELVRVEQHLTDFRSQRGRPHRDRAALARAFIAKAVFRLSGLHDSDHLSYIGGEVHTAHRPLLLQDGGDRRHLRHGFADWLIL